ncbi:MAG: hypothetical protein IJ980_05970 [Oscillospiraceae bacterium]|nr:hypothetical protein [Oscillospiraceae bacterium]
MILQNGMKCNTESGNAVNAKRGTRKTGQGCFAPLRGLKGRAAPGRSHIGELTEWQMKRDSGLPKKKYIKIDLLFLFYTKKPKYILRWK